MPEKPDFLIPPTHLPKDYTQTMYGSFDKSYYWNIYPTPFQVKLCGVLPENIKTLIIRERNEDDPPSDYWGWEDFTDGKYHMVFPHRTLFNMCWPYGVEAEIEMGRGRPVNLIVEKDK